jgi:hypothetical protein
MKAVSICALVLAAAAATQPVAALGQNPQGSDGASGPQTVPLAYHKDDPWREYQFLIGAWVSEGDPSKGSGSFTLEPDLDGKILLRRNVAHVPGPKGGAQLEHEDLMVIYWDPSSRQFRAPYYDSEGHVISYVVSQLPGQKGLVFVSEPDASKPRFRLTYTKVEGDKVTIDFAIAPPGQGDRFRTYRQGTVRRKSAAP